MRKIIHHAFCLLISTFFLVSSALALASEKTCLLEGNFTMSGQSIVISDCAENKNMSADQFREACEWMGNPFDDVRYKAKLTYQAACPANAQAQCQNVMGGSLNFHYYKRDAETLKDTKNSCLAQGGKWVQ